MCAANDTRLQVGVMAARMLRKMVANEGSSRISCSSSTNNTSRVWTTWFFKNWTKSDEKADAWNKSNVKDMLGELMCRSRRNDTAEGETGCPTSRTWVEPWDSLIMPTRWRYVPAQILRNPRDAQPSEEMSSVEQKCTIDSTSSTGRCVKKDLSLAFSVYQNLDRSQEDILNWPCWRHPSVAEVVSWAWDGSRSYFQLSLNLVIRDKS